MQNPKDFIEVNINNLPEVEDVVPGDQLIVETSTGTNIVNFENVIFQPYNTSFYSEIEKNTSTIQSLSTKAGEVETTVNNLALTSDLYNLSTFITTQLSAASGSFTTQISSGSASFKESYVNDLYIPRTQYGIKAAGIFNNAGNWVKKNGGLSTISRASTTNNIFTITVDGLTNSNYVVLASVNSTGSPSTTYFASVYNKQYNQFTVSVEKFSATSLVSENFGLVNLIILF